MIFKYLFVFLSLIIQKTESKNFSHNKLIQHISENQYHKTIPMTTNPINLSLSVALRAFNNINQMDGIITSNIWFRYTWEDKYYSWDPINWENITSVQINTNPEYEYSIWVPDIYLYNTAEKPMDQLDYTLATLDYKGNVFWSRPGLISSTCSFDLTNFPYDTQTCKVKFGSWAYDSNHIKLLLNNNSIDTSNFQQHEEWDLIKYYSKKNSVKYPCCKYEFEDIEFYFVMKRRPGYYNLNIIIPTFATATLMIMALFVPWDSGERISFAVTILLSIVVFLLILSDNLPKSDNRPLLSRMILGLIYFSLVGVAFTIIINALHSYMKNKEYEKNNFKNIVLKKMILYIRRFKKCETEQKDDSDNSSISSNDTIEEYCDSITNFIELTYMWGFIIAFIAYTIVMFEQVPN